ncbi:hypothetical protein STAFG_3752 [Streptomyces afghaniensis 772]|uniref:Uncharacterized protein n=1 Tax=Streptomyces afghaniensis 772 TaxID=1283301 RepID=S4MZ13_9ACTN|nr:hypothetical protein STAFG_3752 [Streptomyces afghaniensis 772]
MGSASVGAASSRGTASQHWLLLRDRGSPGLGRWRCCRGVAVEQSWEAWQASALSVRGASTLWPETVR